MTVLEQRHALLRLLGDDDPVTLALVKEQLAGIGAPVLGDLRLLLAESDPVAALHLREVIKTVEGKMAFDRFSKSCANFGEEGNLEEACWGLAAALIPGEDFSRHRETLDSWGREAAVRLAAARTKASRVHVLTTFLAGELRLRGNERDYYLIENSLLPNVIDSRLGVPISLAFIYQLVAKRGGIQVDGVGLPGHFMVRHEDIFFDPFHGGRRVSLQECTKLMEQQELVLEPHHLAPAKPRSMLLRMLTNLRHIADQTDPPLAEKIAIWMDILHDR